MEHKEKMTEVGRKLNEEDVKRIKYILAEKIGKGIQKIINGQEMIIELESIGFVSENNYKDIITILDTLNRADLVSIINGEYQPDRDFGKSIKIDEVKLEEQVKEEEDIIQMFIDINLNKNFKKELEVLDDTYIEHVGLENIIIERMKANLDLLEGECGLGIGCVNEEDEELLNGENAKSRAEFFKKVGFSTTGAENFENFIVPTIKHCSFQNWLDIYLEKIFFSENLITCFHGFPFEGPNNIRFSISSYQSSSNLHRKDISAWNIKLNLSETDIATKISEIKTALSLGKETWYHGTNGNFAKNIISNGIDSQKGKPRKDFSHQNGFYLQQNFEKAIEWGSIYKTEIYAVLIYNIPEKDLRDFRSVPELNSSNLQDWEEVVKFFRSGRNALIPRCFPKYEYKIDFIRGLVSNYACQKKTYTQNNMDEVQLCSKSQDMEWFLNGCLIGVIFFQNCDEKLFF
ncbi:uncharacterized protein LOC101237440 [Hydra vulgaris]|uniref:uncharacterized protein LOC101237440 n=1 Tax=Hydra vulgaris TaxID=6087 RepID=UPI001F5E92DC|nr:uncharacterized protein LOC101237440 [Hydra vulgaris]